MRQPRINSTWYIVNDICIAIITWVCFYFLRTVIYNYPFTIPAGFYLGALLYTGGWLSLHFLSGAYEDIYHKSAVVEFFRTFIVSLIGCIGLLFIFILKNPQNNNFNYYDEFFGLLIPVFFLTLVSRLLFLSVKEKQLKQNKVFFNVLLIGSGKNASRFFHSLGTTSSGYRMAGFLNTNGNASNDLPTSLKRYTNLTTIDQIIDQENIEEVIITVEKNERELLTAILRQLSDKDVNIKITADAVDIITGAVNANTVMGTPLIDVHSGILAVWQKNIKRMMDIVIAFSGLIILSPLLLYTAIRTMFSSAGPIIYLQERIGFKGKPFIIYKFRSMVQNAEPNGPLLSSSEDTRITRWGKIMRKWRLDELPQLLNVMKGEMSLVGPRPERKFYIDQIVQQHPEFKYLLKVKPGLTSWGMVKFGYASSVDQMIERMPYDIIYIENVSIVLDLKIMLHSIRIILSGKGK